MDAIKNFSYSTVAVSPSPGTTGTSLVVAGGDGTKFPATPFNAILWPTGTQPTTSNAEIVRVTNLYVDTLTITRAQESTTAQNVIPGFQIAAGITAKTITDLQALIAAASNVDGWNPTGDTWTFATASTVGGSGGQNTNYFGTVTIPGDQTSKYYPGMKFKLFQGGDKMGFIMAVSYGAPNTTLTIWTGQTYILTSSAITNTYYSTAKAPAGFDTSSISWRIYVYNSSDTLIVSPNAGQYYTNTTIVIPLGSWTMTVRGTARVGRNGNNALDIVDINTGVTNSGGSVTYCKTNSGSPYLGHTYYTSNAYWLFPLYATTELGNTTGWTASWDYMTTISGGANIGFINSISNSEMWLDTDYL